MKTIIEKLQNQILETKDEISETRAIRERLKHQPVRDTQTWEEIDRLYQCIVDDQTKLAYLRSALVSVYYAAGHMNVDTHEPEIYVTMNL